MLSIPHINEIQYEKATTSEVMAPAFCIAPPPEALIRAVLADAWFHGFLSLLGKTNDGCRHDSKNQCGCHSSRMGSRHAMLYQVTWSDNVGFICMYMIFTSGKEDAGLIIMDHERVE